MSTAEVQQPEAAAAPALPDYLASPNAVLGDTDVHWRYGRAPDYSKTRGVWAQSKKANHVAGSLPELVENLVKNWEVEASFKTRLADWRTVDHANYTFSINGGPPQTGEHMLKVGTYNAVIAPNEYYSPENSDFASSHKTFKRMMPTFAWEVLEVYSGPPRVSFKWRHWGTMKNDYVGFNNKGEKITAKAHGGTIDITGVTIATVDDKVRLQAVDTYFDPLDMFRQIAPDGIVNRQAVNKKVFATDKSAALDDNEVYHDAVAGNNGASEITDKLSKTDIAQGTCPVTGQQSQGPSQSSASGPEKDSEAFQSPYNSSVTGNVKEAAVLGQRGQAPDYEAAAGVKNEVEKHLEGPAAKVHPHPKTMEESVKPEAGEAVAAEPQSEETRMTHEEMSRITANECPFLMNRE